MSDIKTALVNYADDYDIMDMDAFAAYVEYLGGFEYIEEAATNFADAYQGCYTDLEDFAHDYMQEVCGPDWDSVTQYGFRLELDVIAWEQDWYFDDNTGHVFAVSV